MSYSSQFFRFLFMTQHRCMAALLQNYSLMCTHGHGFWYFLLHMFLCLYVCHQRSLTLAYFFLKIFDRIFHIPDHTHYIWCIGDFPYYLVTNFSWNMSNVIFFTIFSVLVHDTAPLHGCPPSKLFFDVYTWTWLPLFIIAYVFVFVCVFPLITSILEGWSLTSPDDVCSCSSEPIYTYPILLVKFVSTSHLPGLCISVSQLFSSYLVLFAWRWKL